MSKDIHKYNKRTTHNCDLFVFGPEFAILRIPLPKNNLKQNENSCSGTVKQRLNTELQNHDNNMRLSYLFILLWSFLCRED